MKHRPDPAGDTLDQAASRAWQASLEHVPTGIRAQLRPGTGRRPGQSLGWPLAAACAVGALAVGLHLQREPAKPAPPIVAPSAAGNDVQVGDDAASAWAALEQTPDFYLWLASADTTALELE